MGKKSKKGQSRANHQRKKKGSGQRKHHNNNRQKNESKVTTTEPEPVEEVVVAPAVVKEEEEETSPLVVVSTTEEVVETVTTVVEEEASINNNNNNNKNNNNKEEKKEEVDGMPTGLEASLSLFPECQQKLAKALCESPYHQSHLFAHWTLPSMTKSASSDAVNDIKRTFMDQLQDLDSSMETTGGLLGYLDRAKALLKDSASGKNPLDGWTPSIPIGKSLTLGTPDYQSFEAAGTSLLGNCGFVLVAGGLGERLGYSNIKIGLPTEMATEVCYIQYYIETILAYQTKFAKEKKKLPLCIMTSNDTNDKTLQLLETNNYFGMDKDQITIVQQGQGVPALQDNNASMVLETNNKYKLQAKPHGHGDIHSLLYTHNVAKNWLTQHNIEWMIFFQDTNGLAFHTLPVALGVSQQLKLVMNSIAVPRKAKQAVGGICTLTHQETSQQRTINVEYNQLDPLLRASQDFPNGDANDETTGYSPFPGNINQLLFHLPQYYKVLERTKGAMPEFVNPKYADETKTKFKKPTRLECMMQDFPTVLTNEEAVGFTSVAADMCFSPVKNATTDGVALQSKGTHPGVAASGEADQYAVIRQILKSIGCNIEDGPKMSFLGIESVLSPQIVFTPNFVSFPGEYKVKFPNPSSIKISNRSSLIIRGNGNVIIESLDLDGALIIDCQQQNSPSCVIRDLVVQNEGWKIETASKDDCQKNEFIRMRGYTINKVETKTIVFKADGTVEGYSPTTKQATVTKSKPPPQEEEEEPVPTTLKSLTQPDIVEAKEDANKDCCIIL